VKLELNVLKARNRLAPSRRAEREQNVERDEEKMQWIRKDWIGILLGILAVLVGIMHIVYSGFYAFVGFIFIIAGLFQIVYITMYLWKKGGRRTKIEKESQS